MGPACEPRHLFDVLAGPSAENTIAGPLRLVVTVRDDLKIRPNVYKTSLALLKQKFGHFEST